MSFYFYLNQDNSTFKRLLFIFNFVIYFAFPVSEYSHKNASAFPPMKKSIRGIMAQLRNWKDSGLSAKFSQWVAKQTWLWLEKLTPFFLLKKPSVKQTLLSCASKSKGDGLAFPFTKHRKHLMTS